MKSVQLKSDQKEFASPSSDYTIIPMQLADVESVHQLLQASRRETYVNEAYGITTENVDNRFRHSTPDERRAKHKKRLADSNTQPYVAKDVAQNIIGYVAPRIEADGTRRLGALYVTKAWHGTGLAHELITKAFDWLDGEGHDIKLGVIAYNERAKAFYRKYGFKEIPDSEILYDGHIPGVFMIRKANKYVSKYRPNGR